MNSFFLAGVALVAATAASAAAAEPWAQPGRDKAVMLYFSKTFGPGSRGPGELGLRWQQSAPHYSGPATELLALRFTSQGHRALSAAGAMVLRLDSMKDEDGDGEVDSSFDSWSKPTFVVVGILAVAGGLCIAKELICKESRRRYSEPDPTPDGPG
jgi:hypothetical protein